MAKWDYDLATDIKRVNAQITTVQRIYGADSSIYKRIVSTIQKAGGGTRFSSKMFTGNMRQIAKAQNALKAVSSSDYLTKEGRMKIGAKARRTFAKNFDEFDDVTIQKMFDVFKNSSINKLLEVYHSVSDFLVDAVLQSMEDDPKMSTEEVEGKINALVRNLSYFEGFSESDITEFLAQWLKEQDWKSPTD